MGATAELRRGWRIILGSLCGIAFGVTGLFFYSMGIFLKPIAQEFHWSRAAASTISVAASLTLAATAPFVGRLVDLVGVRVVALTSSVGLAIGFFVLSRASSNLPTYLVLVVLTILVGAGASPVAYTRLINVWFDRARGTALGFAQTATGIAAALLPVFLIPAIASHGWRAAFQSMGWVTLASAPAILALVGPQRVPTGTSLNPPILTHGMSLSAAVRTPVFMLLAGMLGAAAVGVSGIIVHIVPLLSDAGLPPVRASAIAGLLGIGIIVGRVLTGILVDCVFAPRVAFAAFASAAAGCWVLAWGGAAWAIPATLLAGLAMGAEIDLIGYLVARYYGLKSYGRIYGWLYAIFMVGTAIGPLLAGAAFDRFGNYRLATALLGASLAIAAAITWRLPSFEEATSSWSSS
jgi:MFS family permease